MALPGFVLVSLVAIAAVAGSSTAAITVTVDPISGNDTACLSIQELSGSNSTDSSDLPPCRTLNGALGTDQVSCSNLSCERGVVEDFEDGAVIRFEDGEHRLSGECWDQSHGQGLIRAPFLAFLGQSS